MNELKPKIRVSTFDSETLRSLANADERVEVDHIINNRFHYLLVDANDQTRAREIVFEVFENLDLAESDVVDTHPQAPTIDNFSLPTTEP